MQINVLCVGHQVGSTQDINLCWFKIRVPYVQWRIDLLSCMLKNYRGSDAFVSLQKPRLSDDCSCTDRVLATTPYIVQG